MKQNQKLFFVMGCVSACLAILVIVNHTIEERKVVPVVKPIRTLPFLPPPSRVLSPSGKEVESLKAFDHWLDSLEKDSAGRYLYDSLHRARPGLFDSARELERFYNDHSILK